MHTLLVALFFIKSLVSIKELNWIWFAYSFLLYGWVR